MKRHGFALPLHWMQVTSWIGVSTLAALFFALTTPNLHSPLREVVESLYASSFLLTIAFMYKGTIADPTDEAVKRELGELSHAQPLDPRLFPRLCVKCSTHVGMRSKHCNKCGRCAADFDHHCDWLNNCVGRSNYRFFIALILSLEVCYVLQLAATFWLLVQTFRDNGENLINRYDIGEKGYCYAAMLVGLAAVCISITTSNGYLIAFHCYLRLRNMTTYEFIIARRNSRQVAPAYVRESNNNSAVQPSVPVPANELVENDHSCTSSKDFISKSVNVASMPSPPLKERYTFSRTLDITAIPSMFERSDELKSAIKKLRDSGNANQEGEEEDDQETTKHRNRRQSSPANLDNL